MQLEFAKPPMLSHLQVTLTVLNFLAKLNVLQRDPRVARMGLLLIIVLCLGSHLQPAIRAFLDGRIVAF